MAITILVNGVPLTADSGATIPLSPEAEIQIVVDGAVLDPTDPSQVGLSVSPPNLTLTLADGQVLTLAGFVGPAGSGGGLVGPDGTIAMASTAEGLIQTGSGPTSPETGVEPGAGGTAGGPGGVDAGGSSVAVVTYFEDGFGNIFGISASGDFVPFGFPGFDTPFFDELPLLLGDDVLEVLLEELGEFLLFTDSLILPGLTNPGAPDDFAFFNDPGAPLFNPDGSLNSAFDDVSGSSGLPFDRNITNGMNGNDTVELADKGNVNGNNLKELFGEPTAFYGGTGDDTLTGGNDHDIIVGDGLEAGNAEMDCGDGKKDGKGKEGDHHHKHDETVVLKGDDDTLDGGLGDDVLLGDGLLSKPGFGIEPMLIGFPNLVTPPTGGPAIETDPASIFMPTDLMHNFVVGMFGTSGLKNVLDVEVEKQHNVKLAGGDDTLLGGDGKDLAVGDALIVVEGRNSGADHHHHHDDDWFEGDLSAEEEGEGWGERGHHDDGRPEITVKGGDDTLEGQDGADKLIGDGIARIPSALVDQPHGGHGHHDKNGEDFEHFAKGLRDTRVRLMGGDDTLTGDDGSAPAANIAVFDNPDFVDSTSTPPFAESDEIQANLELLGHNVMTFTGITASDIAAALAGKDVLVIPEQEVSDLADALTEDALDVLRAFVRSGGKLVFAGDFSGGSSGPDAAGAADLMNALFDYGVTESPTAFSAPNVLTDEGAASRLGSGSPTLPLFTGTTTLSGLPAGATSVYEDVGGNSTVALIPEGQGEVVFLGWDWFSSANPEPGSQDADGRWSKVLDTAVRPSSDDTIIGDGILNIGAKPKDSSKDLDAKIAFFDNPDFVDTEEKAEGSHSADELCISLEELGHKLKIFTDITVEEVAAVLNGKDVLVIPELERGDLAAALSPAALEAIRDFINAGGRLVIHGDFGQQHAASLINDLLGTSVTQVDANATSFKTAEAKFTAFEKGPDTLLDVGNQGLSGLPTDGSATSLYETAEGLSTVARFALGHGSITYIGEDWFNFETAPDLVEGEEAWIDLLDIAVSPDPVGIYGGHDTLIGGRGADKMAGDGLINVVVDKHSFEENGSPYPSPCPALPQTEGPEYDNGNHDAVSSLVKGGHDIMHGDAENDTGTGKKVAVFDNDTHVDSDGESQGLQDTLKALGHDVMTFTGITAEEIEAALEGKDVLLIPETEDDTLVGVLTEDALDVIREFVRVDGGKLIIHGEPGDANELLNELFGYDLGEAFVGGSSGSTDVSSNLTGDAGGTAFEGGPAELVDHGQVSGLTNLPDNAVPIYQDEFEDSTVVLFSEGAGQAIFMGWDWFKARPAPGDKDGGWIDVLRRAVEMDKGANSDVMLGDAILNVSIADEHDDDWDDSPSPFPGSIVGQGEGWDDGWDEHSHDGKTILKGGDDSMFGGRGGDVMVGDAILDADELELLSLGHGKDDWSKHEIWFDEELLFSDLTGKKEHHHHDKDWNGGDRDHDAKLIGGNDFMIGGAGDDRIRGDGLWELADDHHDERNGAQPRNTFEGGYDHHGKDHEDPIKLKEADNAKGGHDVLFGGTGNDSVWGEGGHDFITGDGLATGFTESAEGLSALLGLGGGLFGGDGSDGSGGLGGEDFLFGGGFEDIIFNPDGGLFGIPDLIAPSGSGIATADEGEDPLLAALLEAVRILSGFEELTAADGFLLGGDDYLVGGDDDRGDHDIRREPRTAGDHEHDHLHEDLPFWSEFAGLDDIVLGDGLLGLTGSLLPLLELPLGEGEGGEDLTLADVLGIDTSLLDDSEALSKFTAEGGNDTIEGNSGSDLLAGDAIVHLNIGLPEFMAPPSPGPGPELLAVEEGVFSASIKGGDDLMWGDDPKGHKKYHGDFEQKLSTSNGDWDDHEVSYDDVMFGDLIVSVDVGSLIADFILDSGGFSTANDLGSQYELEGGNDTMAGGLGEDVIYGDAIVFATNLEDLDDDDDPQAPGFATGGALSLISAFADFETSEIFTPVSVSIIGGDDVIYGDKAKAPKKHDHHGEEPKKMTSGGDWFDGSYDDQIVGDGLLATGGIQTLEGGDDTIWAGKGDDVVLGDGIFSDGAGKSVNTLAGDDTIDGGEGHDLIYGDLILNDDISDTDIDILDVRSFAQGRLPVSDAGFLSGGDDDLSGGVGNDTVYGEIGDDTVDGGEGKDIVFGGEGSDLGVWGDPTIVPGAITYGDDDLIFPGSDDLAGGVAGGVPVGEADYYDGNRGNFDGTSFDTNRETGPDGPNDDEDTFRFALTEEQWANGALVDEIIEYEDFIEAGDDDLTYVFETIPLAAVEWEDLEFSLFWCEDHVAEALLTGIASITGTSLDDMIVGTGGVDKLVGDGAGEGDDFLSDDIILGLDGDDTILGDRDAILDGEVGGDDKLVGGMGQDTLIGDAGENQGQAGTNSGNIVGGGQGGNDKLFGDVFDPHQSDPTGDSDLLAGDAFSEIIPDGTGGDDLLVGGDAGDELYGDAVLRIAGSAAVGGNDVLFGDYRSHYDVGGDDEVYGDAGTDLSTLAQGGDDSLIGGVGGDTLSGDAGGDITKGSKGGNDLLVGDFDLGQKDDKKGYDWTDDDLIGGDDFLYGDAVGSFELAAFGSDNDGGDDELIGDSRITAELGKKSGHDLPVPEAGDDTLLGDAGGSIGLSSDTTPEDVSRGGNDDLYGDNVFEITLGGDHYGYKDGSDLSITDLLHSGNDFISGDASRMTGHVVGDIEGSSEIRIFAEGGDDFLVGDTSLSISGSADDAYKSWSDWRGGSDPVRPPRVGDDIMAGDALADLGDDDLGGDMNLARGGNDVMYGDYRIELEGLGKLEMSIKQEIIGLLDELGIPPHGYGIPNPYHPPSLEDLLDKLLDNLGGDDIMAGDAMGDMFQSTGGNDTMHGQGGDDTMFGDAGGEMRGGMAGDDVMFGGGDNDTMSGDVGDVGGVSGTENFLGNDELFGGKGDDTIAGDSLSGMARADAGDDIIYGGYGDDIIDGDSGSGMTGSDGGEDVLYGDAGNDTISGGAGQHIFSNASDDNDLIDGGKGDDWLFGDAFRQIHQGASVGDDSLDGGRGDDVLYGDAGGQSTDGGGRGDAHERATLNGDAVGGLGGDDTLDGGEGTDTVFGGGGSDVGIWRGADLGEGDPDVYDGGGGTGADVFSGVESDFDEGSDARSDGGDDDMDTLRLILTSEQFDDHRVWDEIFDLRDQIAAGDDDKPFSFFTLDGVGTPGGDPSDIDLTVIEWEKIEVSLQGCEHVLAIDPTDLILFDDLMANFFPGSRGVDDIFFGLGGTDELVGDAMGAGPLGNDVLVGGLDNDIILGDANANLVMETGGNDKLFGGEGGDTIVGDTGIGKMLGPDIGTPNTEIPIEVALVEDADGVHLLNGALGGNDLINGGPNAGRESFGDGTNHLFGDAYGDIKLMSAGGDDSIDGGQGIDFIYGDAGHDIGDDGESDSNGETDPLVIPAYGVSFTRGGDDRIAGDANTDTISGDAGGDIIGTFERAEGGNDFIVGDQLSIYQGAFEDDVPIGNLENDGDADFIAGDALSDLIGPDAVGGDDTIYGDSYRLFEQGQTIGAVDLGGGADRISGDAGGNLFSGAQGGNDLIFGQGGGDLIAGDALNDFFGVDSGGGIGGAAGGNDIISGGSQSTEIVNPTFEDHDDFISGDAFNLMFEGTIGGDDIVAGDDLEFFDSYGRPVIRGADGESKAGDDEIFGDAGTFIDRGRGGNDWLVGDNLAVIGFLAGYGPSLLDRYEGDGDLWSDEGYGDGISRFRLPRFDDAGEDTIAGDAGDFLDGVTGGNDVIFGDNYLLFADSLGGDVLPSFFGSGFGEADFLSGDVLRDIGFDSVGGNDIVYGQGGGDTITGDAREIFGSNEGSEVSEITSGGNDELYGGDDDDTIFGDATEIISLARAGNDTLFGGYGEDLLIGDARQFFDAKAGDDWLFGGEDDDQLIGDARSNNLFLQKLTTPDSSTFGDDDLWGEGGNDLLIGDLGFATLESGEFSGESIATAFDEAPEIDPDDDDAERDLGDLVGQVGGNDLLYGGKGDDALVGDNTGEIRDFIPPDGSSASRTDGRGGDDTLIGGEGNDRVVGDVGGGGGANLDDGGEGGNDTLHGDEGDDILIGDADSDIQDGAKGGDDTLAGGSGNDYLFGDAEENIEEGNLGISAAGGNDLLIGGSGEDLLVGDAGDKIEQEGVGGDDTLKGEEGEDELYGDTAGDLGDAEELLLAEEPDGDQSRGGNDSLFGGKGNDLLVGDADEVDEGAIAGNDFLDGGKGDDTLMGDAGENVEDALVSNFDGEDPEDDTHVAGSTAGDDTLLGGKGEDLLMGDAGISIDELSTAGNDMLFGGKDDDTLYGDAGDDLLGTGGDDLLDGGSGNDELWGDAPFVGDGAVTGSDTFVMWAIGNGDDIIKDFEVEKDILRFADVVDIDGGGAGISDLELNGVTAEAADGNLIISFADGGSTTVEGIGMTFGPGPVSMETLAEAITVEIEEGTEIVIQA